MNDKFYYTNEDEIKIVNSQCELCHYYNGGKFSDICPKEKLNQIVNNEIKCDKELDEHQLLMGFFTRDEIIIHYIDLFNEDPTQKVINLSDDECVNILTNSIKNNQNNQKLQ